MRIGIDCRMYGESGVGRYIRNLVSQLQILDEQNEYFIFLLKKDFDNTIFSENFHKVLANFKWYGIKEQIKFPEVIKKNNLDLIHFPHFNVPIFYTGKFIVTIHDLIHQNFSMQRASTHGAVIYKVKQYGYKKIFNHSVKKSSKIIVPTNFVRGQLMGKWGVEREKIEVTYEAVEEELITKIQDTRNKQKEQKILEKFGIVVPYIFYIGNAHPHKNIEGLVKAFLKIREIASSPSSSRNDGLGELQLVLAGHDHYFWQRIRKEYQDRDIIFTGYVTDEELVSLYKNAECFVMPSFEEGFGIPILEAMACGCPVVSSNAGSLPEVGGDACLYFNPRNIDDIAEKISQVLLDKKNKNQLIEKGLKRYKKFNWKKLAEETLKSYEKS